MLLKVCSQHPQLKRSVRSFWHEESARRIRLCGLYQSSLGAEDLNGGARHRGTVKINDRSADRDEFFCPEIALCHCLQR